MKAITCALSSYMDQHHVYLDNREEYHLLFIYFFKLNFCVKCESNPVNVLTVNERKEENSVPSS